MTVVGICIVVVLMIVGQKGQMSFGASIGVVTFAAAFEARDLFQGTRRTTFLVVVRPQIAQRTELCLFLPNRRFSLLWGKFDKINIKTTKKQSQNSLPEAFSGNTTPCAPTPRNNGTSAAVSAPGPWVSPEPAAVRSADA